MYGVVFGLCISALTDSSSFVYGGVERYVGNSPAKWLVWMSSISMIGVFVRFHAEVLLSNMGCLSDACLIVLVRSLSAERVCGIFEEKEEISF